MDLFYWLVRALRKWFPVGEEQKQFLMHCLIGAHVEMMILTKSDFYFLIKYYDGKELALWRLNNALKMKKVEELTQIVASAPSFHSLTFQ